jgi:hypothetical protein
LKLDATVVSLILGPGDLTEERGDPIMTGPHDLNQTADIPPAAADSPSSLPATPRASWGALPTVLLLREAPDDSAHVARPNSDAMPTPAETGDRYQRAVFAKLWAEGEALLKQSQEKPK